MLVDGFASRLSWLRHTPVCGGPPPHCSCLRDAMTIEPEAPPPRPAGGTIQFLSDGTNFTCLGVAKGAIPAAPDLSGAAVQPVSTGAAFMAALAALAGKQEAGAGILALQQDVVLTDSDTAGYQLPMNITANRTLVIEGGGWVAGERWALATLPMPVQTVRILPAQPCLLACLLTSDALPGLPHAQRAAPSRAWTWAAPRCCCSCSPTAASSCATSTCRAPPTSACLACLPETRAKGSTLRLWKRCPPTWTALRSSPPSTTRPARGWVVGVVAHGYRGAWVSWRMGVVAQKQLPSRG